MRSQLLTSFALVSSLSLAACGGGEKADDANVLSKGQVVATVNDKDITIHQLNAELSGLALPSGAARKNAEISAVQAIVGRTILADIAREKKIDKSPNFVLQRHRAEEALLVQLLQRDIASKIAPPNKEDAEKFIAENPDLFAQRKVFELDQLQFEAPTDAKALAEFGPLKTMEEVEQKLTETRLKFRRGKNVLDTVGANPDLIRAISKLPAGEIFIIPQGGTVVASRILNTKVVPFGGAEANNYAMNLLQQKRVNDATEKELAKKIEAARKAVKYQKGFEPPKPPAQAKPAAAAPAPKP